MEDVKLDPEFLELCKKDPLAKEFDERYAVGVIAELKNVNAVKLAPFTYAVTDKNGKILYAFTDSLPIVKFGCFKSNK